MERNINPIKFIRIGSPWEEGPGVVRSVDIADDLPDADVVIRAVEVIIFQAKRRKHIENMNA